MKIQERAGAGNHRSNAPAQPTMGERLPTAPRERKPALAALAVLLILVGALGATVLVLQAGDRVEVVKITQPVEAGESVTDDKVTSVMVAKDDSIHYVKWSQLSSLKKLKARHSIPEGVLAVGELFGEESGLPAGKSSVGLALDEGQYPAGLKSGDVVAAYQVTKNPSSGNTDDKDDAAPGAGGSPIVPDARVESLAQKDSGQISSGKLTLNLIVNSDDAAALASAASAGEVALVRVPNS
ncbi:hypothetical protein HUT18_20960 [Streptomyces sp. NA04227]|uniref:hypothetical protein n=1 Tax=Streptomyces sp. NA04227 TaxID=2742136 RepID=UPI001590BB04|nr:hypothetical protein [Streptomyces sp. NA04227]QKW08470.1 hypothetical protein HUT18_20960 [Streptomyces sp. NA04227]